MIDPLTNTFVIKSLIDLRGELKSLYNAGKDEIKYLLDDGLLAYAVSQRDKFQKLKTFLYRNDPVNFYDTYFPLNIRGVRSSGKPYNIKVSGELKKAFQETNCITIIGDAGSGKSMLMKHFFLHFLNKEAEIPLFIELRNLNSFEGTLLDYINKTIFNNNLSPNDRILKRLLSAGKFLILFDGYDELHETGKNKRKDQLNQFIDKYRNNYFVITSRPGANVESLPRFYNYEVEKIKKGEIKDFIEKQLSIIDNSSTLKGNILDVINDPKNKDYEEYMSNPLLLTMFIFTFKNHPEIPHTKNKFYYNVFDTLCTRHDNFSKDGDLHVRRTNLKIEEFEEILKWFSFYSYFDGHFDFDKQYLVSKLNYIKKRMLFSFDIENLIYDLTVSIAIIIVDGAIYKFPHRSLQEYFIALLMSERPAERKIDDYRKKYFKESLSFELNLWTISQEIDYYYFTKALIIELEEFLKKLIGKNIRESILNYFDIFPHSTAFKGQKITQQLYHRRYVEYYLLSYINIQGNIFSSHFHIYSLFKENLQNKKKHINRLIFTDNKNNINDIIHAENYLEAIKDKCIIESNDYIFIRFERQLNIHLFDYFKKIGIYEFIKDLISQIQRSKKELEKELENKRNLVDELFDFD